MNNKDFMNLYKTLGVAFIFILLMSLIFFKVYKYQLNGYAYDITSSVIGSVLEEHPELEEEIIKSLDSSKKFDISKYGINKNNIETLSSYKDNTFLIATTFFCFLLGSLLIISYIYFRYLFEFYDSLQEVSNYIKDVLCNRSVASMKDFREGIFSCIKSDISKIAIELVRNKNNLEKDKKYLEETLSDISHQLKTPLTSMYMINDILDSGELKDKDKHEFLERNRKQLERIEWLVTSLLKLSKLESGMIKLKKEKVSTKKLVEDSFQPLKIPYELKKQDFKINVINDFKITCDYDWTREAIINILKNAHEHTPCCGKVVVNIDSNPIFTEIVITDNGCGINENDIRHIFERFYRGKSSSKESVGIGLNMAKNIIERENGVIEVKSDGKSYTTFTIKFYKVK